MNNNFNITYFALFLSAFTEPIRFFAIYKKIVNSSVGIRKYQLYDYFRCLNGLNYAPNSETLLKSSDKKLSGSAYFGLANHMRSKYVFIAGYNLISQFSKKNVAVKRDFRPRDPKSSLLVRYQIHVTKLPTLSHYPAGRVDTISIRSILQELGCCECIAGEWCLRMRANSCEYGTFCLFIHLQIIVNFRCSSLLTTFFVHVIVYI